MPITGAHHVAITVSDLDKSLDFYVRLLGLQYIQTILISDKVAYKLFGLAGVKVRAAHLFVGWRDLVELYHFEGVKRKSGGADLESPGTQYLSLKVHDLETLGAKLELEGVEFIREPSRLPTGERVAFIRDPDGAILQLIEVKLTESFAGKLLTPAFIMWKRLTGRARHAVAGAAVTKTPAPHNGS